MVPSIDRDLRLIDGVTDYESYLIKKQKKIMNHMLKQIYEEGTAAYKGNFVNSLKEKKKKRVRT